MKNNFKGFTLIELLVVISIIGFLAVVTVVSFNSVRMNARDATRTGNIATVQRALAMYLNDSVTGYPASAGECLNSSSGVGLTLKTANVLISMPVDPYWPTTAPSDVTGGLAVNPSEKFCFYYFSDDANEYRISYYLESNSNAGDAGINTIIR